MRYFFDTINSNSTPLAELVESTSSTIVQILPGLKTVSDSLFQILHILYTNNQNMFFIVYKLALKTELLSNPQFLLLQYPTILREMVENSFLVTNGLDVGQLKTALGLTLTTLPSPTRLYQVILDNTKFEFNNGIIRPALRGNATHNELISAYLESGFVKDNTSNISNTDKL